MFEQIPVAPGSSPGLQIKYQPWKMLGLDSVAWILPVFSLLPLELECKHPVKSDAFLYLCLLCCYWWAAGPALLLVPSSRHWEMPRGRADGHWMICGPFSAIHAKLKKMNRRCHEDPQTSVGEKYEWRSFIASFLHYAILQVFGTLCK